MTGVHLQTLERVLQEFRGPLQSQIGLPVEVETRLRGRDLEVDLHAHLGNLGAYKSFKIHLVAVWHARDPEAFLSAIVEEHLKPFGEQVRRAHEAAADAWQKALAE